MDTNQRASVQNYIRNHPERKDIWSIIEDQKKGNATDTLKETVSGHWNRKAFGDDGGISRIQTTVWGTGAVCETIGDVYKQSG